MTEGDNKYQRFFTPDQKDTSTALSQFILQSPTEDDLKQYVEAFVKTSESQEKDANEIIASLTQLGMQPFILSSFLSLEQFVKNINETQDKCELMEKLTGKWFEEEDAKQST